jgi:Rieske Fe-S protein
MNMNRRQFVAGASLALGGAALWRGAWAASGKVEAVIGMVKEVKSLEPALHTAKFIDEKGVEVSQRKVYIWWVQATQTSGSWHVISAICTHLKCKIGYKADEDKFVCPCHKSEFALDGKVIRKPAKKNLPVYSDDAIERDGKLILKYSP